MGPRKNLTILTFGRVLMLALVVLGIHGQKASADIIKDITPGGEKFYIDVANKDVSSFTGNVGGQGIGPLVNVVTSDKVDTGSGYANIDPVKDAVLTYLKFTPADPNLFGDFSFRGQLANDKVDGGTITVRVLDNQGNSPFEFTFDIDKDSADFDPIGIVALPGETIQWVEIIFPAVYGGFKEVKQIDFSYATPIPEPGTMLLLGSGLVGLVGYGRRRFKK